MRNLRVDRSDLQGLQLFRVYGVRSRVSNLGFRVCRVSWRNFLGFRFFGSKVSGLGFRVWMSWHKFLGFRFFGAKVSGLGFSFFVGLMHRF